VPLPPKMLGAVFPNNHDRQNINRTCFNQWEHGIIVLTIVFDSWFDLANITATPERDANLDPRFAYLNRLRSCLDFS
jgi:hypothetical protein